MGNRAECPACKACTSDVYAALNYNSDDCPYCGCPYDLLVQWNQMLPDLEKLKESRAMKNLALDIENLTQENARLKTKLHKLEQLIAWKPIEDLFDPFIQAKKILEDSEEN